MKSLCAFLAALATAAIFCGAAAAQDTNNITGESYTLPVSIFDKKGKPYKSTPVVVYLNGSEDFYNLPPSGVVYISGVTDEDLIHIFAGDNIFEIPVGGYDSVNIVINNPRKLKNVRTFRNNQVFDTGYGVVAKEKNSLPLANVEMRDAENYTSLISYLQGRVSGVHVVGNRVTIRGVNSINSSTEPMVVVDGVMMSLAAANASVRPRDIESITVDKTGSMYGVRGGNGVIIIKTRTGLKEN